MEAAEDGRLAHQGLHQLVGLPAPGIPGLDVVRALHQVRCTFFFIFHFDFVL